MLSVLIGLLGISSVGTAQVEESSEGRPLQPSLWVRSKPPYYANQSIDARLQTVAVGARPEVRWPTIPDGRIIIVDRRMRPLQVNAIGDLVIEQTSQFIEDLALVPEQAGRWRVPAITLVQADREGRTRPFPLEIRRVPELGRPKGFLGGVGACQVEARLAPEAIELGQAVDYQLRITGEAARGRLRRPDPTELGLDLQRWGSDIDAVEEDRSDEPPVRTFTYRFRPNVAGLFEIPAVPVATFMPSSRRFEVRYTEPMALRVDDPPQLDPNTIGYGPADRVEKIDRSQSSPASGVSWIVNGVIIGLVAGLILILIAVFRLRSLTRPALELRRAAHRIQRRCSTAQSVASAYERALATFLESVSQRPPGVLTPIEARAGLNALFVEGRLGTDALLVDESVALLKRCDRHRYRETKESVEAGSLDEPESLGHTATTVLKRLAKAYLASRDSDRSRSGASSGQIRS